MIARRLLLTGVLVVVSGFGMFAQEKKMQLKNLPAAVQKAVQEHTKGATLVGFSEEREDGKVLYEAETKVNGRTRDLLFDSAGTLMEVEEEVAANTLPAAVQSALNAHGKVAMVEAVTKGSTVTYEAQVEKNGKKSEVVVDSTGNAIVRK
ncbi:MAG: hypothetical protein ABI603_00260 [Acidobacteriota bacterium]